MASRPRIKLIGYRSAGEVDALFATHLVDVAYVDEITPDAIYVVGDGPMSLANPEEYQWVSSIIDEVLRSHGIVGVQIGLSDDAA